MAFTLPKCGGLKFNTASFKQIGNVITNINATSITGDTVTACGQQFDEAYFKVIGKAMTTPTITTITDEIAANCSLMFDGARFEIGDDGEIDYNADIASLLTITTSPTDATVLVVDSNDMPIEDNDGVYPVMIGETYVYTVAAAGYVTQSAEITIDEAVEEVSVTLTQNTGV